MTEFGVTPTQALEEHVSLVRAFRHPSHGMAIAGSLAGIVPNGDYGKSGTQLARDLAVKLAADLDQAATVVVTDRMLDLVLRRVDSWEFGRPLEADDLPFERAFVSFPRSVPLPTGDEDVAADVWPRRGQNGFDGGWWYPSDVTGADKDRLRIGYEGDEAGAGIGYGQCVRRENLRQFTEWLWKGKNPATSQEAIEEGNAVLLASGALQIPLYHSGWQFGRSWDPQYREDTFTLTEAGEFERRFWLSLWFTLREEVLAPVRLPRRASRPAARIGLIPDVIVCDLRKVRRPAREDELLPSGEVVIWSHRWRVAGHDRVLHRGTPQERVIRVKPYVKGPANRPLIEKDRVYRLGR